MGSSFHQALQNYDIGNKTNMFGHEAGTQFWVLGIINTQTKEFRIEPVQVRDTPMIKSFISRHTKRGNNITTEGWSTYEYLDSPNSGYQHFIHNHGGGDFGFGIESTSHIESLWAH